MYSVTLFVCGQASIEDDRQVPTRPWNEGVEVANNGMALPCGRTRVQQILERWDVHTQSTTRGSSDCRSSIR